MPYKKMVAIFVDVIGYKNTTTFDKKYELHRLFHEEVAIHAERQLAIPHVIYDRKIFGFSDCAYFFFYYKKDIDKERKDDIKLSHIAAYNVSLTILRLMSKGYLARGGLSVGDVLIDELGFFGPAVERAHEIESKEANVPRLQFDHNIGKEVFEWEHNLDNIDPTLLSRYTECPFVSEHDGKSYFVNPFNILQRSDQFVIGQDIITLDSIKKTLLTKVEEDLAKFSHDSRVVEKLEWIREYASDKKLLVRKDLTQVSFSTMNVSDNVGQPCTPPYAAR